MVFSRDDAHPLNELPEYLIGHWNTERLLVVDLPFQNLKCDDRFRLDVLIKSGFLGISSPSLLTPSKMGVRTPQQVQQFASAKWRPLEEDSSQSPPALSFEPYLEGSEHNGPCWVLGFEYTKRDKLSKDLAFPVVVQRAESPPSTITKVLGKPVRGPTAKLHVVSAELARRILSYSEVKNLLQNKGGEARKWSIGGYQAFRSVVAGRTERFESVFFRQVRDDTSLQNDEVATAFLHTATGTLCWKHRGNEDSWLENHVVALISPSNAGTQLWLVDETLYEGRSASLVLPAFQNGRCVSKSIATTPYRGL